MSYRATEEKSFNRPKERSLQTIQVQNKKLDYIHFIAFLSHLLAICWLWKEKYKKKKKKRGNIDLAKALEGGSFEVCKTFLYTKFNTNKLSKNKIK